MNAESETKRIEKLASAILELNAVGMGQLKEKLQEITGVQLVAAAGGGGGGAADAAASGPKKVTITKLNDVTKPKFVRGMMNIGKDIGHTIGIRDGSDMFNKLTAGEVINMDFVKPEDAEKVIAALTELGLTCA
jgi:ACT domain-containing protein